MGQTSFISPRQLILLCLLALPVLAQSAEPPPTANPSEKTFAEIDHFKELSKQQLNATRDLLKKDMQALTTQVKELDMRQTQRLNDQSQRIDSLDGHIGHNLTTIGYVFGALSLLVALAGVAGFFSLQERARSEARSAASEVANSEAREAVSQWFTQQAQAHEQQLQELQNRLMQTREQMQILNQQLEALKQLHANVGKASEDLEELIAKTQQKMKAQRKGNPPAAESSQEAKEIFGNLDNKTKSKPEDQYTFQDWNTRAFAAWTRGDAEQAAHFWAKAAAAGSSSIDQSQALFNRGIALNQQGRIDEEISTYAELINRFTADTSPDTREQVARAMFNMGCALGQQDPEAEIAVYDTLIKRFENDPNEVVRRQVADALNSKGFVLLCQAKKFWNEEEIRLSNLQQALLLFSEALARSHGDEDKSMVLGNQAYCKYLQDNEIELAQRTLKQALELGGEALYQISLEDLEIHPIPEKDEPFRALLEKVWQEVNTQKA